VIFIVTIANGLFLRVLFAEIEGREEEGEET